MKPEIRRIIGSLPMMKRTYWKDRKVCLAITFCCDESEV